jgi:hypothetical protein
MKINLLSFKTAALLASGVILTWANPSWAQGKGDNQDDPHSGKVDRFGDGNSGQGDDLHKHGKINSLNSKESDENSQMCPHPRRHRPMNEAAREEMRKRRAEHRAQEGTDQDSPPRRHQCCKPQNNEGGLGGDQGEVKEHSNNGVRDHGKGEGRDGAGQGKGRGRGPRK